ncbi:glycine betaine ABC transporter substrate-binding protein [Nocardia alba]|uniref:Substrate binding protein of glycine betaine ABC transport system n=1 Tax=Nocardia alba TaxID=225051 RepID=A0A4R1FZR4_9NOCA|nr:glycine betaine ABC transporter substrate-binding protein [Nocardia alba]TCJ99760.1 substrate binding protein of glycine betaine ABC transport system [Nocardia alba]
MYSVVVRRTAAAILAATCALGTISCSGDDTGPVVVVGGDSTTESVLLAEIYSQALERAGTDSTVVTGSSTPLADLDAGRIAVLPARNGALVDRWNPSSPARTPDEVVAALNSSLPQGISVSDAADGTDPRVADTHGATTEKSARTQRVVALYRSGIFDRQQLKKLNYVAGELTTDDLTDLVGQVDTGTDPAVAARAWLDAHAL